MPARISQSGSKWEYYLAYCEGAFLEGYVGEVQLLLRKQKTPLARLWTSTESESLHQAIPRSKILA
jgi:hypothetical protein